MFFLVDYKKKAEAGGYAKMSDCYLHMWHICYCYCIAWHSLGAPVTVSDYPPVQVTPGGNLKLVSSYPPLVSNYPLNIIG